MKLTQGVEWSLHCALTLAQGPAGVFASRKVLATRFDLPESYLARHLRSLVRAGVLSALAGPRGGFRLARNSDEITVLDIVEAIDGVSSTFNCAEIRQRGSCAAPKERCEPPCPVAQVLYDADRAWRDSLRGVTLSDIAERLPPWRPLA